MVTLSALCLANGLDMHTAAETELARIWTKVVSIRAKQAAKPKHSPLPEAAPVAPAPQPAPMPYPTDAQIDAVYEQTMGQHLRSQDAPAPVAEDAAYTELHGQINYIAAYSVDALDALDRDRLLRFARSLVRRAQTSLEIANLARAQAAQPEGGAA